MPHHRRIPALPIAHILATSAGDRLLDAVRSDDQSAVARLIRTAPT